MCKEIGKDVRSYYMEKIKTKSKEKEKKKSKGDYLKRLGRLRFVGWPPLTNDESAWYKSAVLSH